MDSKNKVILISVIAGILVIGLVVGANVTGKAVASDTYYCCNNNGVWGSTACWAHEEAWCIQKDAKMSCSQLCISEGFEDGRMRPGGRSGTGDDRHRCECRGTSGGSDEPVNEAPVELIATIIPQQSIVRYNEIVTFSVIVSNVGEQEARSVSLPIGRIDSNGEVVRNCDNAIFRLAPGGQTLMSCDIYIAYDEPTIGVAANGVLIGEYKLVL